jgi:hypothetical protein
MILPRALLILLIVSTGTAAQCGPVFARLEKLHDGNHRALARLFQEDPGINQSCLLKALRNPDKATSLGAQEVIRYLATPSLLKGLNQWYGEGGEIAITHPSPTPLIDVDYQLLEGQLAQKRLTDRTLSAALDQSVRGKILQNQMKDWLAKEHQEFWNEQFRPLARVPTLCAANPLLSLRKHAFFGKGTGPWDIRMLARAKNGRKALILAKYPKGDLREQEWTLVLRKEKTCWAIESITLRSVW